MDNSLSKRLQIIWWTMSGFMKKHGIILVIGLILGLLGFFLIPQILPYIPRPKRHERIGIVGKYTVNQLPLSITSLLGEGLTTIASDGSSLPGLASNWEISEEGLTYTFKLKDNIFWQNAKKLLINQINYNFKDVTLEIIDSQTIRLHLKEQFSPFLTVVSAPILQKNLIGTSQYRVLEIKKNGDYVQKLRLSATDKNITYRFYPTIEAASIAFKLGEVDMLKDLFIFPLDDNWKKQLDITTEIKKDRFVGLFLNNNDPNLGNKSFRQALAYAIKNKGLGDDRALGPLNPTSWAYNPQIKNYNYDPENAKTLLKKVNINNDTLELTISTSQPLLSLAEEIKNSWEDVLKIKVKIEIINTIPQNFQIFLGIQEIPIDPDQYSLWHSTRLENITKFNDARIDKLLEDGRKIIDKEQRKEKYWDFQKFLLEELPVIFLNHPKFYTISRKSY